MTNHQFIEKLTRRLVDEGKIIEAGWISLRMSAIPLDEPAVQLDNMRNVFMCGALHLFSFMIVALDPGDEPTDNDLRKMAMIERELREFGEVLKLRTAKTKGSA